MALSEVQLLQTMNVEVELPITVHVDNVGAIWLSNNRTLVIGQSTLISELLLCEGISGGWENYHKVCEI